MKRDIKDFVSQKRRSKYHTVNSLPYHAGFLDVQNANLFVMYVKARLFLAHYVNCLRLHHQMRSEFDGFHSMRFSRFIHKIVHI
jgi:hypothetical protein